MAQKHYTSQQQAEENLKNFTEAVEKALELSGNLPLRDMFRQFVKEFKSLERTLRKWDQAAVATSNVPKKEEPKKIEIIH